MVVGATGDPISFIREKICREGTFAGLPCSVDADCTGSSTAGRCRFTIVQVQTVVAPAWAVRATEQRTMTGSAINAFSATTKPCWQVRVKNIGTATVYVGYSGVDNTSGVPIEPGEYGPPMVPAADRDCNSVKLYGASGAKAAVLTP